MKKKGLLYTGILAFCILGSACNAKDGSSTALAMTPDKVISIRSETTAAKAPAKAEEIKKVEERKPEESMAASTTVASTTAAGSTQSTEAAQQAQSKVKLNPDWQYASFAKITSGEAVLYRAGENKKGITIAVNAGHGTKGGEKVKTQVHPDGSAKVTGGTTSAGATHAVAVSSGMTFADGSSEASANLRVARKLKDLLLERGYDVLMIRDGEDVQLDNIARTVIANNMAKAHVALHFDSTGSDKGAYYMAVVDNASYKAMEPVASNWKRINAFGESLIAGLKGREVKIYGSGSMGMDLTQTSYSTIPSVVVELGDKATDYHAAADKMAKGLADGIDAYFATQ